MQIIVDTKAAEAGLKQATDALDQLIAAHNYIAKIYSVPADMIGPPRGLQPLVIVMRDE